MDELKLPAKFKAALNGYVRGLKAIYNNGLVSVVLYGSASSGEFTEKYSNINLMVILDDTGLSNLSKAYPLVRSKKFDIITPVFLTEEYIRTSLDVFPIEFLDIIENHTLLYGRDVISGLNVEGRNLRFQCEQELKSKMINIKKRYIKAGSRSDLEDLLFTTFTSTLHIMRNMLRLKGVRPPYLKDAVLDEYERYFGMDATLLREILWAKNKKMALTAKDIDALLAGFVSELELVSYAADKL